MINDLYHKQHALYIHLYILKNQLTVTLIFDERDRFRKWRISINLLELLPRMQKPLLFFQDNGKRKLLWAFILDRLDSQNNRWISD